MACHSSDVTVKADAADNITYCLPGGVVTRGKNNLIGKLEAVSKGIRVIEPFTSGL